MQRGAFALAALAMLAGQAHAADELRFVACPVYRDTDAGKKSGCWLSDDPATGARYDVGIAPTKPDWNFKILVEGRVAADQKNVCGGVVLNPVRVSVLLDEPCPRALIPAETYPGRVFVLPQRNVRPLYAARTPAQGPGAVRDFVIPFDFGSDFITYQLTDYYVDQAALYAGDVAPARIEIRGYAATKPVTVSGKELSEPLDLARRRAERVAEWLRLRGVNPQSIKVSWAAAKPARTIEQTDGLLAPSQRVVEIHMIPGATVAAK